MARPRKDSSEPSVEQRLEEAFWELIADTPIDRITIGALTSRAGCNRGTFYYYYDDIYAMLDHMIDRNLPSELPAYILSRLAGNDSAKGLEAIVQVSLPMIDQLCRLLASASSPQVTKRVKKSIMKLWVAALVPDAEPNATNATGVVTGAVPGSVDDVPISGEARVVLEFAVGGILGIMAYRAETDMAVSIEECLDSLAPEVPEVLARKLRESLSRG